MDDNLLSLLDFVAAMRDRGVARFTWGALSVEFDDHPVKSQEEFAPLIFADQAAIYEDLREELDRDGESASGGYSDEDLYGSSS